MAASTRARVESLTRGLSLRTRETVPAPTPACAATSAIVTTGLPSSRAPRPGAPHTRDARGTASIERAHHKWRPSRCQWNRFHAHRHDFHSRSARRGDQISCGNLATGTGTAVEVVSRSDEDAVLGGRHADDGEGPAEPQEH